eukprot:GHVU01068652.1.p1 GENE.GHVU01068652.1~~GHVU01068652.1.p1  ORF type:complete len:103 (+),score=0.98 GHVU01068652.1:1031-1339(+)
MKYENTRKSIRLTASLRRHTKELPPISRLPLERRNLSFELRSSRSRTQKQCKLGLRLFVETSLRVSASGNHFYSNRDSNTPQRYAGRSHREDNVSTPSDGGT